MAESARSQRGDVAPYEDLTPLVLAAQPVSPPPRRMPTVSEAWDATYTHLESRRTRLYSDRTSWLAHWARVAELFLPRRHHWVVTPNKSSRGSGKNDAIINSTGSLALQIGASGLWSGMTNPARPWFKLVPSIETMEIDQAGKEWIEDTENRVYTILHKSNFYTTMAQAFQDVMAFGTAPVVMYEDYDDVIRCYLPCAGEYFLGCGARLDVDTLYREFTLTVLQIVDMFKIENCPEDVAMLWYNGGGSLEKEFIVCHAIEPNFAIAARGKDRARVNLVSQSFPYREVYWLRGKKSPRPLSVRGFNERPFMVARWSTTSNDAYGRSACMDALGDNAQLQHEERRKGEFIDKLVRPPMGADPELKNEPSSIIPGMITYMSTANGKKGFWPLFEVQPTAMAPMIQDINGVQERINRALFVDAFMAITRMEGVQPRNELELTKRDLERLQIFGPFVKLFENEFAGPALGRVLAIAQRRRMLKPMPPSLQGIPLKVEYVSILKVAQQSVEAVAMKDYMATMGALSSAAKAGGIPDPIRVVDWDKFARRLAELGLVSPDLMFTESEVAEHDEARQEVQSGFAAAPVGMAAVNAAKTLSQTPLGGNSALDAIIGG